MSNFLSCHQEVVSVFLLEPGKVLKKFLHMALVGRRGSAWVDRSFLTTKSGYFVEVLVKLLGEWVVAHVQGFLTHIY